MSKTSQRTIRKRPSDAKPAAQVASPGLAELAPTQIRQKVDRMVWQLEQDRKRLKQFERQRLEVEAFLSISDKVTDALDVLSRKLFEDVLGALERHLTIAIQEVLEQPVRFCAEANFKRGTAHVDFSIDREGNSEDVMRGQGGSVQNILSVGLRMFALATLDKKSHRRFLVLDEQDCWLRPELVPKLVNIVYRAAKELGFQVILISHHDIELFEEYADKIYQFTPSAAGLKVAEVRRDAHEKDFQA